RHFIAIDSFDELNVPALCAMVSQRVLRVELFGLFEQCWQLTKGTSHTRSHHVSPGDSRRRSEVVEHAAHERHYRCVVCGGAAPMQRLKLGCRRGSRTVDKVLHWVRSELLTHLPV